VPGACFMACSRTYELRSCATPTNTNATVKAKTIKVSMITHHCCLFDRLESKARSEANRAVVRTDVIW
jgi:hypothetical protein